MVEALAGRPCTEVACGAYHTIALSSGARPTFYSWGLGLSGRLGHGDEIDKCLPTEIESLGGVGLRGVSCGGHHSAVLMQEGGRLYTWGGGAFGKLGHGDRQNVLSPKIVAALAEKSLRQVEEKF